MPTHAEKRRMPHSPEEMFALVADIDKYPEFLPWCVGTRITSRKGEVVLADMVIGYKMFREKFTSRVTLYPESTDREVRSTTDEYTPVERGAATEGGTTPTPRIDVQYMDGPFKYLNNHWIFLPEPDGTCTVDFYVDFEFRSKLLQKMIGAVFNEAVKIMVHAFEKRADTIYMK